MKTNFDYIEFAKQFNSGDLNGLEYLEETIIKNCKEIIKENNKKMNNDFIREEYIASLFYAVKELNNCNYIYGCTNVKNNFNYDYYVSIRDLLFKELGIDKVHEDWRII